MIRKFLKEPGLLGCVVVTDDKEMSLLLARCCTQSNLSFASVGKLKVRRDTAFLKGLGSRIKFVLLLSLNLILSRVVLPRPRYEGPAGGVGFLTIYPDCLNLQGEAPVEENYLDLPETVASLRGTGSTLFAVHQPSAPSSWYKLLTWRKWLSQPQNPRIVFLSRYSHISDIGLAMLNFLFVFRYFWLDRMDRRFRSSFVYDGVNVYGLVGREFRRWFFSSQIPFYLVVARAVERAVRAEGIQQLVCFLELYPLARAVYYGAKRGNPNITTVAYQHANINLMKLWYSYRAEELIPPGNDQDNFIATMPIPDLYIFQGRSGMNVFKSVRLSY